MVDLCYQRKESFIRDILFILRTLPIKCGVLILTKREFWREVLDYCGIYSHRRTFCMLKRLQISQSLNPIHTLAHTLFPHSLHYEAHGCILKLYWWCQSNSLNKSRNPCPLDNKLIFLPICPKLLPKLLARPSSNSIVPKARKTKTSNKSCVYVICTK